MKNTLILIVLLFSVCGSAFAQNKTVRKFFRQHKHTPDGVHFTVPGALVWMGTGIAKAAVQSPEEKLLLKMAQRFGGTKVLVTPTPDNRVSHDVRLLVADLQQVNGYDPLITVQTGEGQVHIMGKENGKKFKRFMILVEGEDGLVMISAKTRLKYKKMGSYINQLIDLYRRDEPIPEKDPPAPKKPSVPKRNQV